MTEETSAYPAGGTLLLASAKMTNLLEVQRQGAGLDRDEVR